MKIGEISEQSGIPVETVRYYEKIGLLPAPERQANGYRRYRQMHLERLQFVKRCRSLDMAQEEIRELIELAENPSADCTEVDRLLARHLEHVRERLSELQTLEHTLSELQHACSRGRTVAECGILEGLASAPDATPDSTTDNHIPGTHR